MAGADARVVIRAQDEASKPLRDIGKASRDLGKDLSDVSTQGSSHLGKLAGAFGDVAKVAGGFVVGQGLLKLPGLMQGFIGSASDLGESMSKVGVVFGSSAGAIEDFADSAAKNLGMSKGAALEAAGTFGNLFTAIGLGAPDAADLSKNIIQLGTDLASFNNINPAEALDKLRAGLTGEAEPLKSLGVNMNEAAVKAKALELGLAGANGEISESAKVQARAAIIFEQTKTAQGDFARTSDGLANQMRILKAQFSDVGAELGTALVPLVGKVAQGLTAAVPAAVEMGEELADRLSPAFASLVETGKGVAAFAKDELAPAFQSFVENDIAPKFEAFRDVIGEITPKLKELADEVADRVQPLIETMVNFLGDHKEILGGFAVALGVVTAAMAAYAVATGAAAIATAIVTSPILGIVVALTALATGVILVVKHWDEITAKFPALGTAADGIKTALSGLAGWITSDFAPAVQGIASAVTDGVGGAIDFVTTNWPKVQAAIAPAMEAVKIVVQAASDQMKTTVQTVIGVIQGVIDIFVGTFTGDWSRAWDGAKQVFSAMWDGLEGTVRNAITLVSGLVPLMLETGTALGGAMLDGLMTGLKTIPGLVGDLGEKVWQALKSVINSAIDQMNDMIPNSLSISVLGKDIGIDFPDNPIPHLAIGARNFRGGMALVGEQGPELVKLPTGADVFTAAETKKLLSAERFNFMRQLPTLVGPRIESGEIIPTNPNGIPIWEDISPGLNPDGTVRPRTGVFTGASGFTGPEWQAIANGGGIHINTLIVQANAVGMTTDDLATAVVSSLQRQMG